MSSTVLEGSLKLALRKLTSMSKPPGVAAPHPPSNPSHPIGQETQDPLSLTSLNVSLQNQPLSTAVWRRQQLILANKFGLNRKHYSNIIGLNGSTTDHRDGALLASGYRAFASSQAPDAEPRFLLGDSVHTLSYAKGIPFGDGLLQLLATRPLYSLDFDTIYSFFDARKTMVSRFFFSILDYLGLCVDLRGTSFGPFNNPFLPLLYLSRKYERLIYDPTEAFGTLDSLLAQCSAHVPFNRDYWAARPVLSYVSKLLVQHLLETVAAEYGAENVRPELLYPNEALTENYEPIYPLLYVLFRLGAYDDFCYILRRYSEGIEGVLVSLGLEFTDLVHSFTTGPQLQRVRSAQMKIRNIVSSPAYRALLGSVTTHDPFLTELLSLFDEFPVEELSCTLQHIFPTEDTCIGRLFEFRHLYRLILARFLSWDSLRRHSIRFTDVANSIPDQHSRAVRTLVAFHEVLCGYMTSAVEALAEDAELLPEAVTLLYFFLGANCYPLTTKGSFPVAEATLKRVADATSDSARRAIPIEVDTDAITAFVLPAHLDTTTTTGVGSILLAFVACHCSLCKPDDAIRLSCLLPVDIQLIFLTTVFSLIAFDKKWLSPQTFRTEVYQLIEPGTAAPVSSSLSRCCSDSATYHLLFLAMLSQFQANEWISSAYQNVLRSHSRGTSSE
ncbi:hypothetical protein GMRT_14639 [Giardia muris]|uniref:Uncharacterized protein n=1 Tax=Giardia muris TaxID=5742 RepID=A0A4Z1SZE1_GIAMU|nr:hypothetical protein GMRT_14639 [Giardia muris]|eukprot:TNJ27023.1 hypothetical protein GMRT_14639 [Giardia muris]